MIYLGIDIGGTKCAVIKGRCSEDGNIIIDRKISFPTADLDTTMARIFEYADALLPFDRIGISCGGPLDEERGLILSPPNLPGFDEAPICDMLKERYGKPTRLCNDANACALAEWRFGAGKGSKNMAFLTFGTGLGAGLILNGKLYSGTNGNAGEIGHIRLAQNGPMGYGKEGSFEGFCSGGGIARLAQKRAAERIAGGTPSTLGANMGEIAKLTTKDLAEMANAGNEEAKSVFAESAKMLGFGLSILIDIINPEVIVIGSVFARSRGLFEEKMNEVIATEALGASARVCRIVPALLGDAIGDVASISVAMEE